MSGPDLNYPVKAVYPFQIYILKSDKNLPNRTRIFQKIPFPLFFAESFIICIIFSINERQTDYSSEAIVRRKGKKKDEGRRETETE